MLQKRKARFAGLMMVLLCLVLLSGCGGGSKTAGAQEHKGAPVPLYVVNSSGVSALDANSGQSLWQFKTDLFYTVTFSSTYEPTDKLKTRLIAYINNTLIVSGKDALYGLNGASGQVIWKEPWPAEASRDNKLLQLYTSQNMVYAAVNNFLYAFEARTGVLKWRVEGVVGQWISDAGVVAMISSGSDYTVEALDGASGTPVWSKGIKDILPNGINLPNDPLTQKPVPAIKFQAYADQTLVVGTGDQQVFALDASNGGVLWKKSFSDEGWGADVREVTALGSVLYVAANANGSALWAYTISSGQQLWEVKAPDFAQNIVAASERVDSPSLSITDQGIFSLAGPTSGDVEDRSFQDGSVNWTILGTSTFDMIQADKKVVYTVSKGNQSITSYGLNNQKQLWSVTAAGDFALCNGIPYATAADPSQTTSKFSALDPQTGRIVWTADLLGEGILGVVSSVAKSA